MSKRLSVVACSLGLVAVLAVAGCGGSGSGSATAAAPTGGAKQASTGNSGSGTVDVASNPQLGRILVNSQGLTLYTFQKDTGSRSTCSGACAQEWPPAMSSGSPKAGSGVNASMLGTSKRSDGTMQVTYGGHPVYTFAGDQAAGQATGNGLDDFGGVWTAVQPSGAHAPAGGSSGGSSSSASSTGGSSGSYGY
jgi:predicted lipoprotein with Yx(FWY)xxD motif